MSQQDEMRGFQPPNNIVRGNALIIPRIPPKVLAAFPQMEQWRDELEVNFEKWRRETLLAIGATTR